MGHGPAVFFPQIAEDHGRRVQVEHSAKMLHLVGLPGQEISAAIQVIDDGKELLRLAYFRRVL
jgi:hypothetical protein